MDKRIKKILFVLGIYAFAGGLYYNFLELWILDNGLSVTTVGTVLSLCSVVTAGILFHCGNVIKTFQLKKMVLGFLITKCLLHLSLFFLYGSGFYFLIKFFVIIDFAVDTEIYSCIYPLISNIQKSDKLYTQRELTYNICYYFGVIITSFLVGKTIVININYNIFVILSAISLMIATILFATIDIDIKRNQKDSKFLLIKVLKNLKKDKISLYYILSVFFLAVAYYGIVGISMTILTKQFSFSPTFASSFKLSVGIISVIMGYLFLHKINSKNNYVNIFIKYGLRLVTFVVAILLNNNIVVGIAIVYILLSSSILSNKLDAPFVNRYSVKEQVAFSNLKDLFSYCARALGTFLCGFLFTYGINYNFIVASIFMLLGIVFSICCNYLYNKEK